MEVNQHIIPVILRKKQEYEEGVIYETTDYGRFTKLIGNRDLHNPLIEDLKKSIMTCNMLRQRPGVTNEKDELIDGQNRLQACIELDLPFPYTVKFGAGLAEAQLLQTSRQWTTENYLKSFMARGYKDYVKLHEFSREYKISTSIAMHILGNNFKFRSDDFLTKFRKGKFEIVDYSNAENFASLLSEVRKFSPDNSWNNRDCIRALTFVLEQVDPKEFIAQLARYNQVITKRASVKDYLRQFDNIWNANRKGKQIYFG